MQWETVIGLEVHVQLATKSKLFSESTTVFGREPNTQACIYDLAYPGVLPSPNAEAIAMAVKFGLSVNATIARYSVFDRKNYFYPDLPKGYQISQYHNPIIQNGYLEIELEDEGENSNKRVNISHAHLEEDAGKLLHEDFHGLSGIDFNRAGIPLLEIVSAPDLRNAKEAVAYLKNLHSLVRYLDISDGNMQEGSLRADVNVSVRLSGEKQFGVRTETKNLNSFRFVEQAIEHEVARQIAILEQGGNILQETRLYDPKENKTYAMRSKEESLDYRYFPDPDLLPLLLSEEYIAEIAADLPELPWEKTKRFQEQFGLNKYDAEILSSRVELAEYFEKTLQAIKFVEENAGKNSAKSAAAKLVANWIIVELLGVLNKTNTAITESPIAPKQLAELLDKILDRTISGKIAKQVFQDMLAGKGNAVEIISRKDLQQVTDDIEIRKIVGEVVAANPKQVEEYRSGKTKIFGFFVGRIMQITKGKVNPELVNAILTELLHAD